MAITIILTLVSIAVGGLITFLVTRWYYERASGDLEREAGELKDYTVMLLNYLDDAGVVKVERDAGGNPIRVRVVKVSMTATGTASASLQPKVIRHGEQDDSHQQSDNADQ
jgi:hypothetical protein